MLLNDLPAHFILEVLLLYRLVTWLTGKSSRFEHLMEGRTECLITARKFSANKFDRESLSLDEFFTELRSKGIEHLGQVRKAYMETTGDVSVYYFEDRDVMPGLPINPELFGKKSTVIAHAGCYACTLC